MLKDGFLRFCEDPELACCKAEAELESLRTETIKLKNENENLRNELCLKCGRYLRDYAGGCDGCRWRRDV